MDDAWLDTFNTDERRILDLRELGLRHALSLGRFRYRRAAAPLPEQRHESWLVLVYVIEGSQRYHIDGQEHLVRGGQMLRVLPGQKYSTGEWPEQRGDVAWLILDTSSMSRDARLGMSAEGADAVMNLLLSENHQAAMLFPPSVPQILDSIFEAWESAPELLRTELIRNRLASLLLDTAKALQVEAQCEAGASDAVRRVVRSIKPSAEMQPSVDDLIAASRLPTPKFYEEFKAITGTTPLDYLVQVRVQEGARRLTDNPDSSITDIAFDLGFSSSQYFATVFRRYFGTTPGEWRARKEAPPTSRLQR